MHRESAVCDVQMMALEIEGTEAGTEVSTGERRMLELRQHLWDAEAELTKAQAEGPANHRKRDFLDKACVHAPAR